MAGKDAKPGRDSSLERKQQAGITIKKADNFSDWYNEVVLKSGLVDYASTKGFMFIKPHGYAIWEWIQKILDAKLKEKGHENAYAPAVIPESLLAKEAEHVKGFAPECFYITRSGSNELNEKLVLRPTSETIIYESYAKWIRSYRDLPVLMNFWNSVFRAEIKMTKLFIRTCEFLWQEGHTVHATEQDADREVLDILDTYQDLAENYLAIKVLKGKKSEGEKFAGALYTTAIESLMPDGKALQMGTSHNLGQHFSKTFGIKFIDKDEKEKLAWQTSWGVSTRLIGAIVMVHGDDKGLVLPPQVAPIQIAIVPIIFEQGKQAVTEKAQEIYRRLKGKFRTKLDDRIEYTAGWKFNEWEMKGVPLRIEVGPKDVEKKQVVVVSRVDGKKDFVPEKDVETFVEAKLATVQKQMLEKSEQLLKDSGRPAKGFKELKKLVEARSMAHAGWCGDGKCEEAIKQETTASIRVIPFGKDGEGQGKCVYCGKAAKHMAYFAKAY
ncbi:MAG: proline--tRNA ligase [Candidatus Aenigmarchaeota archaeon]|nr:proline--tRNA ligase [Candidatus Aenigmarchaeota archaeon]